MNELVTTLNQLLNQRFEEYNRMFINLLKIDTQMIISIANATNSQDEQVRNLITELNNLTKLIENNGIGQNPEFFYLTMRRYLREILNNAEGGNGGTETEST